MPRIFSQVCKKCGSEYTVYKTKLLMRDTDKIDCEVCGTELLSWNGAVMYEAQLNKRGEWPKKVNWL